MKSTSTSNTVTIMAYNFLYFVFVFVALTQVLISAYIPGYPAPYPAPYPYPQPYPNMMGNYGYPVYPYPPQYPMMPQPYPMQFPAPYAPQYPMYASHNPMIPVPDVNTMPYPSVLPGQLDQSQVIPGSNGIPNLSQTVSTQYGNVPVEIIDVPGPQGLPSQFNPYGNFVPVSFNNQPQPQSGQQPFIYVTEEDPKNNQTEVVVDSSQSVLDVDHKSIKTESIVEAEPSQTKIFRTIYPKTGKINVEVQTSRPEKFNSAEDSNAIKPILSKDKKLFG